MDGLTLILKVAQKDVRTTRDTDFEEFVDICSASNLDDVNRENNKNICEIGSHVKKKKNFIVRYFLNLAITC